MKLEKYCIKTHSAKQREMIYDLIFNTGLIWQCDYPSSEKFKSGNDVQRRFPFNNDSSDGIVIYSTGYVALGSYLYSNNNDHIKLDANTDFISILQLITQISLDYKSRFQPIEVPLNETYTATIIDKCGKVKVGCQEFEASIILDLAKQVRAVINS